MVRSAPIQDEVSIVVKTQAWQMRAHATTVAAERRRRCRGIFYPPNFLSGRIEYSIRPDNFS